MGIWKSLKALFRKSAADINVEGIAQFQTEIGYHFKNPGLVQVALTHRSYAKSNSQEWLPSNERLEFLGDSVLGMIVADYLYRRYPDKLEGGLTKRKSLLVNEGSLHRIARDLGLGRYILLSEEENKAGGRRLPSINADALEAVIGAIYLDGGLTAAKAFVSRILLSKTDRIMADKKLHNYKGELLEYLQSRSQGMPRYEVIDESGPDHDKVFTVEVYSNGEKIGYGTGLSKKDAEQKAAAMALEKLKTI